MFTPSWNVKFLLSSTIVISGATFAPFDLQSNGVSSNQVEAASKYYTTTANLNLRSNTSSTSTILLTIPSGSTVTYIGTYGASGSWFKISYKGVIGYVAAKYLKAYTSTSNQTYTTTANLNLRKSASTSSSILLTIPSGKEITYLDTYGSWYKVSYNGTIGYVSSAYVKVSSSTIGTASTSSSYSTTENLNLRQNTSTTSAILLTIPSGSTVKYLGTYGASGSWYKVSYNGATGYVASKYVKVTTSNNTSNTNSTVVIDAGHGGTDPGAIYGSVQEKVIVLDIAKRLANTLTSTYQYNVQLTRETDNYISLADRVSFMQTYNGKVFVSLHANSSTYSSHSGQEVLVPTTESYTTNPYVAASRQLGTIINKELAARIPTIQNRGVKYQNVYVVGKNVAPSALVEYGFISNSNDRSHLTSTTYRQRMAEATASGVHQFIRAYY